MTANVSHRFITTLSLLGIVALSSACSSSNASSNGSAGSGGTSSNGGASGSAGAAGEAGATECPNFMGQPVDPMFGNCDSGACFSCVTPIQGMSFANGLFSNTDATGVTREEVSNPEPGKVCMLGTSLEYAALTLLVLTLGADAAARPLDAAARGITQLEYTIETPPSVGVLPQLEAFVVADTPPPAPFDLLSGTVSTSTPQRVSLSDFKSPDGFPLDLHQLVAIAFHVDAVEHYDFCIRDLKFLDANGVEVTPSTP